MSILIAAAAVVAVTPACTARKVVLSIDSRDGDFNGMSHSGTYLVIRNTGRRACGLPGLPFVTFHGARGVLLPASRQSPVGMHPGPVIVPVTIPAHGRVATALRWVSGPVYDRNRRLVTRTVDVTIGGRTVRTPFRAAMFAPVGEPARFDQPPLVPFR